MDPWGIFVLFFRSINPDSKRNIGRASHKTSQLVRTYRYMMWGSAGTFSPIKLQLFVYNLDTFVNVQANYIANDRYMYVE